MKFSIRIVTGLFLVASASYAGITIDGTTVTFSDATEQSTAALGGGAPADHGGTGNTVNGTGSFIGGGILNSVTDDYGTVGAGYFNMAGDDSGTFSDRPYATVGGGYSNWAKYAYSTVGGGRINEATDVYSTVGGGYNNEASGDSATVAGGYFNTASGFYATVAGGHRNTTAGAFSFAAGNQARIHAVHNGTFLFADSTSAFFDSTNANQFAVRASGGVAFYTDGNLNSGATMATGAGAWSSVSARATKENFTAVDPLEVLEKVAAMPVETWNYKSQETSIRHIGPMAEDFRAAFGVGDFVGRITSTDADGVALAAIQGLNAKLEDTREELVAQAEVNTALRWHNAQLEARLDRLENAILGEGERTPGGTD